jgi:hypothetical protein
MSAPVVGAWRLSPVGVLIPTEYRPKPAAWPRPVGWAELPAELRAEWDAKWRRVGEQQAGAR